MNALWGLLGAAVTGLMMVVVQWMRLSQAQATGATVEAGQVAAVTAQAQAAMLQAAVQAPSPCQTLDRLKDGTF